MSEQDNLRVARQGFDAWNAHDSDSFVKLIADDFVSESDTLPTPLRGRDGARQSMQMYIKAFPDLRFDIEQMIASGEYVVTRWHATGTHKGELMGIPATGRRGDGIHGCTVAEYRDAKAVREWVYWDVATLLRQIGVMPALMRAV
jgi:C-1 hydroxylase